MDQTENKQSFYKKFILINIIFLIFFSINYSQEIKQIEIISAGSFDRNEALYPDGNILKKDNIKESNILIGLASNGFHSNGYSLIRKIIKENRISLKTKPPYKSLKKSLGDDLIEPTKIYIKHVLPLVKKKKISAIAHITGGGIYENLDRIIPKNFFAEINTEKFTIPDKFLWLKKVGKIKSVEMLKTFNCGVGFCLIVNPKKFRKIQAFFDKVLELNHGKLLILRPVIPLPEWLRQNPPKLKPCENHRYACQLQITTNQIKTESYSPCKEPKET